MLPFCKWQKGTHLIVEEFYELSSPVSDEVIDKDRQIPLGKLLVCHGESTRDERGDRRMMEK